SVKGGGRSGSTASRSIQSELTPLPPAFAKATLPTRSAASAEQRTCESSRSMRTRPCDGFSLERSPSARRSKDGWWPRTCPPFCARRSETPAFLRSHRPARIRHALPAPLGATAGAREPRPHGLNAMEKGVRKHEHDSQASLFAIRSFHPPGRIREGGGGGYTERQARLRGHDRAGGSRHPRQLLPSCDGRTEVRPPGGGGLARVGTGRPRPRPDGERDLARGEGAGSNGARGRRPPGGVRSSLAEMGHPTRQARPFRRGRAERSGRARPSRLPRLRSHSLLTRRK